MTMMDQNERMREKQNGKAVSNVQLYVAVLMCIAGIILLGAGFALPPTGKIDSSVLVAFGETLTFAGAIFGIDYTYRR